MVLLYFGYVNCPDECPLTTAPIKLVLEGPGDSAKNVQVGMISIDPVRDTPYALKDFMEHFNSTFLDLTGTQEDLQKVWNDFNATVEQGGETHSTFLYVNDPGGNVRQTFVPDAASSDIGADISLLLKGK